MLKRILLLLGETPASLAARDYAFRLVQEKPAELTGLAGIDLSAIEEPMPGGIGTTAYKVRLEEQLKKQAEETRARLRESYEQQCRAHAIPFEWLSFEGDPIGTLYLATETRDLVTTGHDTAFAGDRHEQLPEPIEKLLAITSRPVVVCGDEPSSAPDALVAYEGSVAAMRALQMFALLGIKRSPRIHVTAIDANQELAARRDQRSFQLLALSRLRS